MQRRIFVLAMAIAPFAAVTARADVVISSSATANMTCSGGVRAPTATVAVLNTGDLETLLASGNVTVTTTGSGVQAINIAIANQVKWSSSAMLTLDAYQSVTVQKAVSVRGKGGLSVITDDGGTGGRLSFSSAGNISFHNLSSNLSIDGTSYVLIGTLKSLASAVAANPAGDYAFANAYDASPDGTYSQSPVPTAFTGSFEGLGNTISNITLSGGGGRNYATGGLFSELDGGTITDIGLVNLTANVTNASSMGGLAGVVALPGMVVSSHVGGTIHSGSDSSGGLVGDNTGTIEYSYSTADVASEKHFACGLVGTSYGTISQSFAEGQIKGEAGAGGLVCGNNSGRISESYAIGMVSGGRNSAAGGFLAGNEAAVSNSYSTGKVMVKAGIDSIAGGFIGDNYLNMSITNSYWDKTTSKRKNGVGYGDASGLTGLTTKELRSGLPSGFDPTVWAENPKINNGFPYLIANPPPK